MIESREQHGSDSRNLPETYYGVAGSAGDIG